MRVVSEYLAGPMKVSVFSWNEKFMVKLEYGPYEQWFKFPQESVSADRLKTVMDEAFMKMAEERFLAMHNDMRAAFNRHME